jgi:hypothetical protein
MKHRPRRWNFRGYYAGGLGKARAIVTFIAAAGLFGMLMAGVERWHVDRVKADYKPVPCYMEFCTLTRETGRSEFFMPAWHYVPLVKFKFEFQGTVFTGTSVSSRATAITSKTEADAFLGQYGPGALTECHVDPDDPASAMLILPHDRYVMQWLRLGTLTFLVGFAALVVLHLVTMIETRPRSELKQPRAPGWGEIDSGPQDALSRTRNILREKLER